MDCLIQVCADCVVSVRLQPCVDDAGVEVGELARALEDRRVERLLGQREGAGRNRRELLRDFGGAIEQHPGRALLIDQPDRPGFVHLHGPAGEDQIAQRSVGEARPHDLQRQRRERHADGELRNADAAGAFRHDPVIARRGQDAAAGNRVAVDRRHDRLRKRQRGAQEFVEHRQEAAAVFRPVLDHAKQIDAGGKRRSRCR